MPIVLWIIYGVIFAILVGVAIIFVLLASSIFGGLDYYSGKQAILKTIGIIRGLNKPQGVFIDLGSAWGNLAWQVQKQFPLWQIYGIDDSRLRIWAARARFFWTRLPRAKFLKGDIFTANVSKADVVYIYLDRGLLPRLEEKLKRELKPGALAITTANPFPTWQSFQIFPARPGYQKNKAMFVYRK